MGGAVVGLLLVCGLHTMHSVSADAHPAEADVTTGHTSHHSPTATGEATGTDAGMGETSAHGGCDDCGGHAMHVSACMLAPTKPAAGQVLPPADLTTRPDAPVLAATEPTAAVERWTEARRPSLITLSISRT